MFSISDPTTYRWSKIEVFLKDDRYIDDYVAVVDSSKLTLNAGVAQETVITYQYS